jgi:hypothetical protein
MIFESKIRYSYSNSYTSKYTNNNSFFANKLYIKTPKGKFVNNMNVNKRRYKEKNITHNFTNKEWEEKVKLTRLLLGD